MRNALVVALVCSAALAACNKAEEQVGLANWEKQPALLAGVDDGATATPASGSTGGGFGAAGGGGGFGGGGAPRPVVAAAPGTVPVRKAGLWQTTTNSGQGPARSGTLCVTDETELRRGIFSSGGGRGGPGCDPKIAKGANGAWTSTMSCTREMGEATMKQSSSQTLTGDLNVSYKVTGRSTTSGSPREEMNGTRNTSASGTYKGPCPAGAKGGDYTGSDGEKRNIFDQQQGRGGPGGGFGGPGGANSGGRRDGGGRPQTPAG